MPPLDLSSFLQVILALGLINVWLVRSGNATTYRGSSSTNLKGEFAAYGLPVAVFYIVGAFKLGSAAALLAGLWYSQLVLPAAGILVGLMVGAVVMHIKVKDPPLKSAPALAMLAMSTAVLLVNLG